MDRRSWPWKKRSTDKTVTATDANNTLASSGDAKADQDDTKSVKYVQISVESYAHLTDLEEKVKVLNEKVSSLNDKLSSAQSEMITKDNLVKQHAKVAEEAVSGWEKAEAEALALKQQLESVMLQKLTVEDRASHLDAALKECTKQVRNVKEESEQKLHDVVFAKTKQWEKAKAELAAKIVDSEQELLRSNAEITALSRTLQERSNLLMKIGDEKSHADAEIEVMKGDIESCEREICSLKYELHLVSKELEIRNEEKNMSMRSAEAANRQHLEDVKKITKLEAECQRLRGLVRKKLPGPAALAQMKIEVENLGRDHGESRLRQSARTSSPRHMSPSDFALENMQQCHKENEFLTSRLLAMEEEMKMLKEALSKRNGELQASRNMCAKTTSKLRGLEAHFLLMNQQKSLSKSMTEIEVDIDNKPSSLTSMSEDGVDEEGSCSESWATALMSPLSQFKRERNIEKSSKADSSNKLELMDDFLEMEKLACTSSEANRSFIFSDGAMANLETDSIGAKKNGDSCDQLNPKTSETSNADQPAHESASNKDYLMLSKLQCRIASLFECQSRDADTGKLLDGIRCIVHDAYEELPQHSVNSVASETHFVKDYCLQKECNGGTGDVTENEIALKQEDNHTMVEELKDAISHIHDFILLVGKEATKIQGRSFDDSRLTDRIAIFSASVNKVLCNEESLHEFLLALSQILSEKSMLNYTITASDKGNEGETCTADCIDKVTLLENKVASNEQAIEKFSEACMLDSHSSSEPEIEGPINSSLDLKSTSQKCSLEEYEQLKLQKENMDMDLARCKEMLELKNYEFMEMDQHLSELNSQLVASKKSNSLAETQLKCMAESYKSLESQKQELAIELNLLHMKAEMLEAALQEEKNSHQDDLAKYKELQDQMKRNSKCAVCSDPSYVDVDARVKKERGIAAAEEKLAECQETIFLLSKQLNSLRPLSESRASSPNNGIVENEPSASGSANGEGMLIPQHSDQTENVVTTPTNSVTQRTGCESHLNVYNSHMSVSDTESSYFPRSPLNSKPQKQRSTSPSSSSFSNTIPEKHGRGLSRFFSKGRSEN